MHLPEAVSNALDGSKNDAETIEAFLALVSRNELNDDQQAQVKSIVSELMANFKV